MSPVFHQERENLKDSLRALIRLVRAYEDSRLIEKARALVPWENMIMDSKTKAACERDSSDALAFWDYLMVELARWFKMDFFQWCDEPLCPQCGLKTASAKSMLKPTPDETSHGANRVEAYNCASCNSVVRFPRYNSVEKLMETRIGRCGEWANCFTFFCRVLGFQARYVIDWHGDHVWTEYFSPCQKRWIHVDPCENIIDNPLMYEHGWSKQVTFIFGVARDHIADVTTRYSCDHKAVIQRRAARYHPGWLFDMVHGLNQELQMVMPQRERDFLNLQMVQDFMDMMYERRPSEASLKGRTSGSSTWVSARGEGGKTGAGYIFRPTSAEMEAGRIHIRYNCRLDAYERVVEGKTLGGWHNGTHHCGGIFRKEEFDWKMVYLARMDRVDQGFMSWRFELKDDYDCMYPIDTVFIRLEKATYENGSVKGVVCSRKTCAPLVVSNPETSTMAEYPMMKGSCSFMVQAALMGGTGSHAWQHAQLFRQSTMPHNHVDETWPFEVIVKFRPRPKDAERSLRTEKET